MTSNLSDYDRETMRLIDDLIPGEWVGVGPSVLDRVRAVMVARDNARAELAEVRAKLAEVEALCDQAERGEGQGIIMSPGFSTYFAVETGLLRAALASAPTDQPFRHARFVEPHPVEIKAGTKRHGIGADVGHWTAECAVCGEILSGPDLAPTDQAPEAGGYIDIDLVRAALDGEGKTR